MTTTRSFTSHQPATLQLHLPAGSAHITVDPTTDQATVRVVTADNTGPAADAVNNTTEETLGTQYTVRVPASPAASTSHTADSGSSGNHVTVNNNHAAGGQIISGGNINVVQRIGTVAPGAEIVLLKLASDNPAFSLPAPTPVQAVSGIRVHATVPPGTAVDVIGNATDVNTVGRLETLTFRTVTGSLSAGETADVTVEVFSADVHIGQVQRSMDIKTVDGGITVTDYRGVRGAVTTLAGDISVNVTSTATGRLDLSAISGDVIVSGSAALDDLIATSVSGTVNLSRR